tara:strand:+ start:4563 stop:5363 length:801 start_codon:yes stop_codon:yes gene_type:complete
MNVSIVKKIFKKDIAIIFLKEKNPNLFGLRTPRCRTEIYLGNNIYEDISNIPLDDILKWTRDYSINNKNGKYYHVHKNIDYYKKNIKKYSITKEESPCYPEKFSECVVKPSMRMAIKNNKEDILTCIMEEVQPKLLLHVKERITQQLKADYSEYLLFQACPKIIPTLHHKKGTDLFLVEDNSIIDLDVKTTRSTFNITDPKKAIIQLYMKQGDNRFSCEPRLYIALVNDTESSKEDISTQLYKKYDIDFTYKKQKYNVCGTRIIFM